MKSIIKSVYFFFLKNIPFFNVIYYTKGTQTPVKFRHLFWQKIIGYNRKAYWPTHFSSVVSHPENIYCGIETCPGFSTSCYIQGYGGIYIGDYTQIGPNVGIVSTNHDLYNNSLHIKEQVTIGKYCWIGKGATILPGVELGDYIIVGAGAVVTKSFPDGYMVIAGNPAKPLKKLEKDKCVYHKSKHEYNGFIPHHKFESFRKKNLNI
jgi:serine acetyltransferase